jgi:hypothetical protein
MAARIPMMAMTTSSSIRVKPRYFMAVGYSSDIPGLRLEL